MPRRRLILVCATALVVAVGLFLLLRGGGEEQRPAVADPLGEALSYAPASAEVVLSLDVQPGSQQRDAVTDLARTFPAARFAADELRGAVQTLGLDPDADLPSLLGGPLVVTGSHDAASALTRSVTGFRLDLAPLLRAGAVAAIVGRSADDVAAVFDRAVVDGRLRRLADLGGAHQYALSEDAGRAGVLGADVVLAGTTERLRNALDISARGGGLTRAAFEDRLGPLRGPALVRLTAPPRRIIAERARGVPWVDALRGGAVALRVEKPGLRLRAHLATDASKLGPQDLPLAPGPAPPSPAPGRAPVSAGVRGLNQTIHVLDAARDKLDIPLLDPITSALGTLDEIRGPLKTFGRIDVDAALIDQLTGTTTLTRERDGIAIRAELRDGGPVRTALNRIAAIPDVAIELANITDLDLDKSGDDAYEVRRNGTTFLRLAVLGRTLVVTTDLTAGLRAIAARPPAPAPAGPGGALSIHVEAAAIQDLIVDQLGLPGLARLALGGVGDLDVSGHAERSGLDLDAALALHR